MDVELLNPHIKLYETTCFKCHLQKKNLLYSRNCSHRICSECVIKCLYHENLNINCPCLITYYKKDFTVKSYYETLIENEIKARKYIQDNYFRSHEDFQTIEEYNEYLGEVEDLILQLLENPNERTEVNKILERKKNLKLNDLNKIKREQIIKNLKVLCESTNPANVYCNLDMQIENNEVNLNTQNDTKRVAYVSENVVLPQLINKVPIKKGNLSLIKLAGGYDEGALNNLYSNFALSGLEQ